VVIAGESKPFGASRDSVIDLRLHRLDLPRYAPYLPKSIGIKLPSGALSFNVLVHFIQTDTAPSIRANGAIAIDQLDLRDGANAPLLALNHGEVRMSDVEPLAHIAYIEAVRIESLKANLVRNHDGTTNLSALNGSSSQASPVSMPTPAAVATLAAASPLVAANAPPATPPAAAQFDAAVDSFVMTDSVVNVTDLTGTKPSVVELDGIHASMKNLRTLGQAVGSFDVGANIKSGGVLDLSGTVQLPASQATLNLKADQIDLPGLQNFAQSAFAGVIDSGKFSAHATVQSTFAPGHLNVHAEPADVALDGLAIRGPRGKEQPVTWKHFSVQLGQFDLASKQATVKEVRSDGLHVAVTREHNGTLSLMSLMRKPAPPPRQTREQRRVELEQRRREQEEHRRELLEARREARRRHGAPPIVAKEAAPAEPPWKYNVESVVFENTDARVLDRGSGDRPVRVTISPLNFQLKGISNDFAKSIDLDIGGTLNRTGTFKVTGTAAIDPLKANLRIETKRLQLRDAQSYVNTKLNAEVTSAALTMNGDVALARVSKDFQVGFQGDVTLGDLIAVDKLTGDDFLKWNALRFTKIDAQIGKGAPKVTIQQVSLADFYARIILNKTGKMNLSDIVAQPQEAPKSLTRAEGEPGATPQPNAPTPQATPAPAPAAPAAPSGPKIDADVTVNQVVLSGGKVDYTDDFIQPNYSANLTDMEGKVGKVGTQVSEPADVELQGHVNGSAPLNISGSVNPLAPMAFVDLKAKADGIELTGLTPYSTKYTGYPIEKGTLTVDVHYMLNNGSLTADNHIFIDQLTFGDRVENSTAMNLPIRLAVSLLKNSKGEINLDIPISGSLSDPKFSLGGIILHALVNLIMKAVTSPFSLLASAIGGGSSGQDLSYVVFTPGYSTITPDAQAKLDTIAKALQERQSLKVSICGRVDPSLDRDGFKEAKLDGDIKALKLKSLSSDQKADAQNLQVTPEEYDKYLKKVYSAGDFKKPRDAIGLAKSLPPDEMKKLIIANTKVTDDDLKKLADARANAVRRYLGGKVDPVRLFLIAPKLNADGITGGKTTRADLSLQ
jgi:hypothetical protein